MRLTMSLLSFRPGRVGGAEMYVRKLVEHLPAVAGGDELSLVADRDVAGALSAPGWRVVATRVDSRALVARRLLEAYTPWRDRALQRDFEALRPDVVFFPQQSIFPARMASPSVVTVGDVQHLFRPDNFGLFDRSFRARVYPRSMDRARALIAISEFTRRSLVERCGIASEKIAVVPHGFDAPAPEGAVPPPVSGEYFLFPAATYAHKGHATLFRSYAVLKQRGDLRARLVLTGQRTALWRRRLEPLARELGIARDVVHLGFLPHRELRALYAGASAVLFPSEYEGFGLPVLEAAQAGARVVTSRLEVFDEIGVPTSAQIDFGDAEALLAALRAPGPLRLRRAPITWRECAHRTLEVLRLAASDPARPQ